jgi:hypothetical protein
MKDGSLEVATSSTAHTPTTLSFWSGGSLACRCKHHVEPARSVTVGIHAQGSPPRLCPPAVAGGLEGKGLLILSRPLCIRSESLNLESLRQWLYLHARRAAPWPSHTLASSGSPLRDVSMSIYLTYPERIHALIVKPRFVAFIVRMAWWPSTRPAI